MTDFVPVICANAQYPQLCKVPEGVALRAYEVYAHVYDTTLAFDFWRERWAGFSYPELVAYLYAHGFPRAQWVERYHEAIKTT